MPEIGAFSGTGWSGQNAETRLGLVKVGLDRLIERQKRRPKLVGEFRRTEGPGITYSNRFCVAGEAIRLDHKHDGNRRLLVRGTESQVDLDILVNLSAGLHGIGENPDHAAINAKQNHLHANIRLRSNSKMDLMSPATNIHGFAKLLHTIWEYGLNICQMSSNFSCQNRLGL